MLARPQPPHYLHGVDAVFSAPVFEPSPTLLEWLTSTFIDDEGALANPDHSHLTAARIGCLWTNVPNSRTGRRVVGQCEFKPPGGSMGKWQRARAQAQLYGWFGGELDFLLTFDAQYAATCSDAEFCALCEHELYHCGQARDEFGAPKFSKSSGLPVLEPRAHDIEQFVGVVARYGADAAGVRRLIEAAAAGPSIAGDAVAIACGTCAKA